MASRWETFALNFEGGLRTQDNEISQGLTQPGSAVRLTNFEPSLTGGYELVTGYSKFDSEIVPYYGQPRVAGASQTGTSLVVSCLDTQPDDGDTFTIAGVTGTYTISSSTYSSASRRATLTITPTLASSPANAAIITFLSGSTEIQGVHITEAGAVIARRGASLWVSSGSGWSYGSVPDHNTSPQVDGGGQTGTSLDVDGLYTERRPEPGDTFMVAGIDDIYTVTACTSVGAGAETLTITPALASSPADNAALTFLSAGLVYNDTAIQRGYTYMFSDTFRTAFVDGNSKPFVYDQTAGNILWITEAPSEVEGATDVAVFQNYLFFAKDSIISYMVVASDSDFSSGLGAGSINTAISLTRLYPFRGSLVLFGADRIKALAGTSISNWALQSITDNIGCAFPDTIEEVGGDILFLSQEGVRFLSDTERSGDFALSLASRAVQDDVKDFTLNYTRYQSVIIPEKNQYRVFGFSTGIQSTATEGYLATQFGEQSTQDLSWAYLQGFKVKHAQGKGLGTSSLVVFSNDEDYVYQMENGNNFDGGAIPFSYWSPALTITDPNLRKTIHTLSLYGQFQTTVTLDLNLIFDLNESDVIQPPTIELPLSNAMAYRYGSPGTVYGVATYGLPASSKVYTQTIGAGNFVSIRMTGSSTETKFRLDFLTLEFSNHGRK